VPSTVFLLHYSRIAELNPRDAAQSSAKIEQYFTAGWTVDVVWYAE
jgi:hypothetical protein